MPRQYTSLPLAERFRARIDQDGPIPEHRPELGPCWLWTGRRTSNGYGTLTVRKNIQIAAHRLSWTLAFGPILDNLQVLHHCDNPPCVRPDHLWLGTRFDNMRDCAIKGRNIQQRDPRDCHGERNGRARLTRENVQEIRAIAVLHSIAELARRYGVSGATIWNVVHRRTWLEISEH